MTERKPSWIRARMPTREELAGNRWLAPIAHRFLRSELWRFTRRSVPRGVALGLFAGFIVPLGQIFLALFLALPTRANVPIATLVTFVTNPFTLPFWLVVANRVGRFVLSGTLLGQTVDVDSSWWSRFGWFMQTAGVTSFGFIVLSVMSAAVGYLAATLAWRVLVARRWQSRPGRFATAARKTSHAVGLGPAE